MKKNEANVPSWRYLAIIGAALLTALWCGMLLLLVEIRYEHQVVLGEKWQAWIPIMYLAIMLIVIPIGAFFFRRMGRTLLIVCFALMVAIGTLGFWFHTKGKPAERLSRIAKVVFMEPGHLLVEEFDEESHPPILAPLSLAGLGVIGVLVCLLTVHVKRRKI